MALELMEEDGLYCLHPRNSGGLGAPDHAVLARCLREDLVLVTENAGDFRVLASREALHPGLILLPCTDRETAKSLIRRAVAHLRQEGDPMTLMVNHVMEITREGSIALYPLPDA